MEAENSKQEQQDRQWVVVPGLVGWVREHDPETESGIAPIGKYRKKVSGGSS